MYQHKWHSPSTFYMKILNRAVLILLLSLETKLYTYHNNKLKGVSSRRHASPSYKHTSLGPYQRPPSSGCVCGPFQGGPFHMFGCGENTGLPESVCGDPFRIFVCSTQRNKMWMTKKRSYVSLRGIKEDEVRSELSREGWTTDRNGTNWKSWERRKQNLWAERNSSKLSLKKIERTTVEE